MRNKPYRGTIECAQLEEDARHQPVELGHRPCGEHVCSLTSIRSVSNTIGYPREVGFSMLSKDKADPGGCTLQLLDIPLHHDRSRSRL